MHILIERNTPIPMRDGVLLQADIYRPETLSPVPAIVCRLPYNKDDLFMHMEALPPLRAAEAGYAVVFQDTRGRYASQGDFYPFIHEGQDGYDTIEWVAAQAWCSGAVGMVGASYFGATQWLAAVQQPPHLKALFPVVTSSGYDEHWTYQGGAFQLGFTLLWTLMALAPDTAMRRLPGEDGPRLANRLLASVDHLDELYRRLPLADQPILREAGVADYYFDWLAHETPDAYWQQTQIHPHYPRITVPAFNVGAWYDLFLGGTLENYTGMRRAGGSQAARRGQRLLIAPWCHGNFSADYPHAHFGIMNSSASLDLAGLALQYFAEHLKGQPGSLPEDPVRIFVMGANRWRDEKDWPLPGTRYTPLYLSSQGDAASQGGRLSFDLPGESQSADHYLYDPRHPVPTLGGPTFLPGLRMGLQAGPIDQRPVESRLDVLKYTSEPLQQPLEATGPLTLVLYASSSAEDTDFVARLCDVDTDGASRLLAEGVLRARFRDGLDRPAPLKPGQVYELRINLLATSNLFLPGHCIRLDITSSSFPRINAHPNVIAPLASYTAEDLRPALQSVYHTPLRPSHLLLPIVDEVR
jgi:hypothetical protein